MSEELITQQGDTLIMALQIGFMLEFKLGDLFLNWI
jgi:hypothetical protein